MFTYIYQRIVCVTIHKTSCKQSTIADFYLELYFAPASGRKICKIKIKTLLECPNKEEANENTKLVITLSSQTGQITSAGQSVFYSDSRAISILGANVSKKYKVRYPKAIVLFNRQ